MTLKTIKYCQPVYKGHSREPENVPFNLHTGQNYMHYSLIEK
jgi:hypothetical protein